MAANEAGVASCGELIERDVAAPLGLADTTIELDAEQAARAADGYAGGAPAPRAAIGPGLACGGALRSTGRDLHALVRAALAGGAAWALVLAPRRPRPHGVDGATGLLIDVEQRDGRRLLSKDGVTAGFHAQLVMTTDPPVAVVVVTNVHATEGLRELTLAILDAASADPDAGASRSRR